MSMHIAGWFQCYSRFSSVELQLQFTITAIVARWINDYPNKTFDSL